MLTLNSFFLSQYALFRDPKQVNLVFMTHTEIEACER